MLPLLLFINRIKKKDAIAIAVYGILFFSLLTFWDYWETSIPRSLKKLYQSSYTLLEYSFFAFFLLSNIKPQKILSIRFGKSTKVFSFRSIIYVLSFLFIAFQIFYFFYAKSRRLDTFPVGIETILLFIYIFYFFYQYFKNTQNQYIYNEPCFWVSVGIMIYMGGSFFFNILGEDISKAEIEKYWFLTYIAETLKNILFVVALFMFKRKPVENSTPKSIPYLDLTI